jgi:hypothetical protein
MMKVYVVYKKSFGDIEALPEAIFLSLKAAQKYKMEEESEIDKFCVDGDTVHIADYTVED